MHATSSIRQERRPAPSSHQTAPACPLTCACVRGLQTSPTIRRASRTAERITRANTPRMRVVQGQGREVSLATPAANQQCRSAHSSAAGTCGPDMACLVRPFSRAGRCARRTRRSGGLPDRSCDANGIRRPLRRNLGQGSGSVARQPRTQTAGQPARASGQRQTPGHKALAGIALVRGLSQAGRGTSARAGTLIEAGRELCGSCDSSGRG
jgi:hypothetical protein